MRATIMMVTTLNPKTHKRAFTLIEILVVVGIIALLVAILLPTLSRARDQSNRVACLANLRTIGQAMVMYANVHHDRLPNENAPNTAIDFTGTNDVLVAFCRDYVRTAPVFHCPSDVDDIPSKIETADYLLPNSARVSYDFYSVFWMPEYGPRLPKVKRAPLAWDIYGGKPTPALDQPNQNHGIKGGNVVFADGHAEWQEQKQWDGDNWPNPAKEFYKP